MAPAAAEAMEPGRFRTLVGTPRISALGLRRMTMRATLTALIAVTALGLSLAGPSAAPVNGTAMLNAMQPGLSPEPVDCRRYPHRHKNAKPHGWGFGCPKKARPAKKKQVKAKDKAE
jgi:hypothetical protein